MAVGGGSRSDYWLRLLASVLDCPIQRPVAGDFGGAFGAARLALMAATGAGAEAAAAPASAREFAPDPDLKSAFDDAQARYVQARTQIGTLT